MFRIQESRRFETVHKLATLIGEFGKARGYVYSVWPLLFFERVKVLPIMMLLVLLLYIFVKNGDNRYSVLFSLEILINCFFRILAILKKGKTS